MGSVATEVLVIPAHTLERLDITVLWCRLCSHFALTHATHAVRGHDNWRDGLSTGTVCLIAQLEVTYTDGTTTIVATNGNGEWKVGQSGTITNNIYLGERYDFRKASPPSWATSSVDDSLWPAAVTYASASADADDNVSPISNFSAGSVFCGECGPNGMPNPGMKFVSTTITDSTARRSASRPKTLLRADIKDGVLELAVRRHRNVKDRMAPATVMAVENDWATPAVWSHC